LSVEKDGQHPRINNKRRNLQMEKQISSLQNPLIKKILLLQQKSRERRRQGLFVVEGLRECQLALEGGYAIETLLDCPKLLASLPEELDATWQDVIRVDLLVYQKIAYRSSTEGVLALVSAKPHGLNNLELKTKTPLILVAEAPEKPGNIGALLRTADAAGLDAVIIANPRTDLYNPNIIRSSVGCLFSNQVVCGDSQEVIRYLKNTGFNIFCAALQASKPYHKMDFTGSTALVVGTEANGLTQEWLEVSHQNIIIPMSGSIDSMNVSVAAGILIFEAKRQRNFL